MRRLGPFRTWEVVVIAIAAALFIAAALAGPHQPLPVAVAPPASPGGVASAAPTAPTAPSPPGSPAASAVPTPVAEPTVAPSPVATADQIVAEEVGEYILVDRRPPAEGPQGGAVEAAELRYELDPPTPRTDVFHAIEIHPDEAAADLRVKTFAKALSASGFSIVREQPLRGADGQRQGYFIALEGAAQRLLLWSNQNVTFSLGGERKADVNGFYDSLPY